MLALLGFYHLASPSDDSPAAALLVELPGVLVTVVEISLVALHVPLGILHLLVWARRSQRTPVLDAAIRTGTLQLHFHLKHEVGRLATLPDDVGRPRRVLSARLTDDAAILHVPYFAGPVPAIQRLAVENLGPAHVVIEVDGVGLGKEAAASMMSRRLVPVRRRYRQEENQCDGGVSHASPSTFSHCLVRADLRTASVT